MFRTSPHRYKLLAGLFAIIAVALAACSSPPAGPTAEEIRTIVREEVQTAVSNQQMPSGPTAEEIRGMVQEAVMGSVPEGVTAQEINQMVESAVQAASSGAATSEEIQAMVEQAVRESSAALSASEVEDIVNAAIEAIPTPERQEVVITPTPMAMPGEGVTVQPARATWNTGYFQEAVYSALLEELGYEVEDHQELDNPVFYQAVANGDVDFWANGWFPLHSQYEDTFSQGAEIAGTVAEAGALQGYLIDMAGQEEFGITSLADFTRDEVKQAYDADGNGMADLYGCPPGWGCNTVIGFHLDEFGLRDHVDEITAGYSASMADAIARYQNGEHILFYTWTPNWTVNQLTPGEDVAWIEVPEGVDPNGTVDPISGVTGCVADPCQMGFPGNDIDVVANSEFLDNNPAAAELFAEVSIPLNDIFRQNNRMNAGENTQDDIDRHAIEWIATNRDMVDEWLAAARATGM